MNWVFISSSNCRSEICRLVFSIEAGQGICGAVVSSEIAKGETFHFLIHKEQASWCREFPNYRSFRGHMQNRHKRRLPMFTPYIYQYTSVNFFALLKITWFGIFLFSFACFFYMVKDNIPSWFGIFLFIRFLSVADNILFSLHVLFSICAFFIWLKIISFFPSWFGIFIFIRFFIWLQIISFFPSSFRMFPFSLFFLILVSFFN